MLQNGVQDTVRMSEGILPKKILSQCVTMFHLFNLGDSSELPKPSRSAPAKIKRT